jgi:hypothetical protein
VIPAVRMRLDHQGAEPLPEPPQQRGAVHQYR